MTKMRRSLWLSLGSGVFIAFLLFVVFYKPTFNISPKKAENLPDFLFEDVTISRVNNGELIWELQSVEASVDKKEATIYLETVQGDILNLKGVPISFFSRSAVYRMDSSFLVLKMATANIHYQEEAVLLVANRLVWSENSERLIGKEGVRVFSNHIDLSGGSFEVNIPQQKVQIRHLAHADVRFSGLQ